LYKQEKSKGSRHVFSDSGATPGIYSTEVGIEVTSSLKATWRKDIESDSKASRIFKNAVSIAENKGGTSDKQGAIDGHVLRGSGESRLYRQTQRNVRIIQSTYAGKLPAWKFDSRSQTVARFTKVDFSHPHPSVTG
jgi:hypothetical protein